MELAQKALPDAKMDKHQVYDIGPPCGWNRTRQVQKFLQDIFLGKLNKPINPYETAAYGAAVRAAMFNGDKLEAMQDLVFSEFRIRPVKR
ncbi:Heat shock 70 kDa protein cognate [Fasciolopsis buskii]|uniref:Heat shock 70 kDa protein cognate n=1 Tax=Fasciolopsis buskii TaxID=27845 RepID=A0A8E0RMM4_9TREM|nr:Heat shock 70 kDa protein cognate [Fasciolopsis buski]